MHNKSKNNISLTQNEACINEYKGNLFEYMVGLNICQLSNLESQFYTSVDIQVKKRLMEYESTLRKFDLPLLKKLLYFSFETAKRIKQEIKEEIVDVNIVGKLHNRDIALEFKEADLLVRTKEDLIPISLKLSKKGAYVNTKSAGVKSFIKKYFSEFDNANQFQEKLNQEVDRNFYQMGEELYQLIGIDFPGYFDDSWHEQYPDRPGQLDDEMKKIVQDNYRKTNKFIYEIFDELSKDGQRFMFSLLSLIGLGHPQLWQVICFNEKDLKEEYQLDQIIINYYHSKIEELKDFKLMPLNVDISSFEIRFFDFQLQIRVKPMNKFTTPSYKINCSVHYGEKM